MIFRTDEEQIDEILVSKFRNVELQRAESRFGCSRQLFKKRKDEESNDRPERRAAKKGKNELKETSASYSKQIEIPVKESTEKGKQD